MCRSDSTMCNSRSNGRSGSHRSNRRWSHWTFGYDGAINQYRCNRTDGATRRERGHGTDELDDRSHRSYRTLNASRSYRSFGSLRNERCHWIHRSHRSHGTDWTHGGHGTHWSRIDNRRHGTCWSDGSYGCNRTHGTLRTLRCGRTHRAHGRDKHGDRSCRSYRIYRVHWRNGSHRNHWVRWTDREDRTHVDGDWSNGQHRSNEFSDRSNRTCGTGRVSRSARSQWDDHGIYRSNRISPNGSLGRRKGCHGHDREDGTHRRHGSSGASA